MWRIRNLPAHTHSHTRLSQSNTCVVASILARCNALTRHEEARSDDEHDSGRHAATTGKTNATFSSPAHLNWN